MLRNGLSNGEERRDLALIDAGVSIMGEAEASDQRFTGHAAVFDVRTAIGNPKTLGFYEQIAPGAFTKTLTESDARFLVDHSSYHVVSRASAGTLQLSQDERGLATNSALDKRLSYVNDLIANLDNGNIRGMSFGFQVIKDDWATEDRSMGSDDYKVEVRTIREVKLFEVSSVTFPAYEATDAGLRYSLVPALRHRGDIDAIARAVSIRPELGPLLGYDPDLAPVHISLSSGTGGNVSVEERGPIAYVKTPTSDAPWSASANVENIKPGDVAALRGVYAWADSTGDSTSKGSYKFPHHFVSSDGKVGAASTVAAKAIIAILHGARGGAKIPVAHKSGVHAHAAHHLRDAGQQVPDQMLKNSSSEPAESTHTLLDPEVDAAVDELMALSGWDQTPNTEEPAASTPRSFEFEQEQRAAVKRALDARMKILAA